MMPVSKTALWFFGVPAVLFLVLPFFSPRRDQDLNKAVFSAFREVEFRCMAEKLEDNLSDPCAHAYILMQDCINSGPGCPPEMYHAKLEGLGFTLPPLFLSD